jgi:hypothetical protein
MADEGRTGQSGHWSGDEQAKRQRRLAALRDLTQQPGQAARQVSRTSPASAPPEQDDTLKRQRVGTVARSLRSQPLQQSAAWRLAMAALVIVILAAGAWALHNRQPAGKATPPPPQMPPVNSIDLGAYNLSCPMDLQWSPDGTQIALWATLGDCGNQQTGGPELAIFDTRTGKLANSVTLYSLLPKQGLPGTLIPSPFAWSPDGASLSFTVGYTYYQAPADAPHGLITITLAHDTARYIADPAPLPATMDGATRIWDMASGTLAHTIAPDAAHPWGVGMPSTGAYAWGADGSLAPANTDATGKGVVWVWQTGTIVPVYAIASNEDIQGLPDEYVPQDWVYSSNIPQWSPDHRYLALPVSLAARLPAGPHAYLVDGCPQLCNATPVAPLDMAFSAALTAAIKGWTPPHAVPGEPPQWYEMDIAWRADRHELATMLPNEDFNLTQPIAKVSIFNTQTGALVTKLPIPRAVVNGGSGVGLPPIAWSPRGDSLAALDYADATLTLWRAE